MLWPSSKGFRALFPWYSHDIFIPIGYISMNIEKKNPMMEIPIVTRLGFISWWFNPSQFPSQFPIFGLQDFDLNDLGGFVRWTPNGAPGVQVGGRAGVFFFFSPWDWKRSVSQKGGSPKFDGLSMFIITFFPVIICFKLLFCIWFAYSKPYILGQTPPGTHWLTRTIFCTSRRVIWEPTVRRPARPVVCDRW